MTIDVNSKVELEAFCGQVTEILNEFGRTGIESINSSIKDDITFILSDYNINMNNAIHDIVSNVKIFSEVNDNIIKTLDKLDDTARNLADNSSFEKILKQLDDSSVYFKTIDQSIKMLVENSSSTKILDALNMLLKDIDKANNAIDEFKKNADPISTITTLPKILNDNHSDVFAELKEITRNTDDVKDLLRKSESEKNTLECLRLLSELPVDKFNDICAIRDLVKEHCEISAKSHNNTLLYALLILNAVSTLTALAYLAGII